MTRSTGPQFDVHVAAVSAGFGLVLAATDRLIPWWVVALGFAALGWWRRDQEARKTQPRAFEAAPSSEPVNPRSLTLTLASYTPAARRVVGSAQVAADNEQVPWVLHEHLQRALDAKVVPKSNSRDAVLSRELLSTLGVAEGIAAADGGRLVEVRDLEAAMAGLESQSPLEPGHVLPLSDDAHALMARAQADAMRRGHPGVAPLHVLFQLGDAPSIRSAFAAVELHPDDILLEVELRLRRSIPEGALAAATARASGEATRQSLDKIGVRELFLGVLTAPDSEVKDLLKEIRVSAPELRAVLYGSEEKTTASRVLH